MSSSSLSSVSSLSSSTSLSSSLRLCLRVGSLCTPQASLSTSSSLPHLNSTHYSSLLCQMLSGLFSSSSLSELCSAIFKLSEVPQSEQRILIGFPPREIDQSNQQITLRSLGILSGDLLRVEHRKESCTGIRTARTGDSRKRAKSSSPTSSCKRIAQSSINVTATLKYPSPIALNRLPNSDEYNAYKTHRLRDIIQGKIITAWLFAFSIDIEFLQMECPQLMHVPRVHLITHGVDPTDMSDKERFEVTATLPRNWSLNCPYVFARFGAFHTKMMLLVYETGLRVWIGTANFEIIDWQAHTNGMWIRDFPLKTTLSSPSSSFEKDLTTFIGKMMTRSGQCIVDARLDRFDFSSAEVHLVASVPGYYTGKGIHCYGHGRLRAMLKSAQLTEKDNDLPLTITGSSIGSMKQHAQWVNEFSASCFALRNHTHIIWPSHSTAQHSTSSGACHFFDMKQKLVMHSFFHHWQAQRAGRQQFLSHMKVVLRQHDGVVSWLLLTSANLSQAAWGTLQKKNTQLFIRSFELGVLFLPSLYPMDETALWFSCTPNKPLQRRESAATLNANTNSKPCFRLVDTSSCATTVNDVYFAIPFDCDAPSYKKFDSPWGR